MNALREYIKREMNSMAIEDGPFCPFYCGGYCDAPRKKCWDCTIPIMSYVIEFDGDLQELKETMDNYSKGYN